MTGERLNWLLHALGTTGKELSGIIEVDSATLSKWRKDKRILKYDSPYAYRIAHWAMNHPKERETKIIQNMLGQQCSFFDSSEPEQALRLWLTMPDCPVPDAPAQKQEVFEVPLRTSLGLENMLQAQNALFELLNTLPDGQEIVIADFNAVNWANVPHAMLSECVRSNREAISGRQHRMLIVDQLTETYRPRDIMFQWMPVYLQSNVRTRFYRTPKPAPLRQNFLLIRGQAALTVSSTSAEPERMITSLYRDPEYVQLFDTMVDILLADSKPAIQVMKTPKLLPFLRLIGAHMRSTRLLYMINRLPTFRNMPEELLDEVLRSNGITGELHQECMAAGRLSTATRARCDSRQVYDLDALEHAVEQEYIIDYDLSALAGREIRIDAQQLRRQLHFLCEHVKAMHYSLAVYPFSRFDIASSPPCNMIVQDDGMVAAWDAQNYDCRMYSEEISVVNGFYQYADSVWEQIPTICRSPEWCRRRIDELLTMNK